MQDSELQVKRYFGLKLARTIFKLLTFLGAFALIVAIILWLVSSANNPPANFSTLGQLVFSALERILIFYTIYQVIDVVLSINDNLRQIVRQNQAPVDGMNKAADRMVEQTKKLAALLEQHHRRLQRLESEKE